MHYTDNKRIAPKGRTANCPNPPNKETPTMFCKRCDLIIDTPHFDEPACNCHTKIEEMSDAEFIEIYDELPAHLKDYFKPPAHNPERKPA